MDFVLVLDYFPYCKPYVQYYLILTALIYIHMVYIKMDVKDDVLASHIRYEEILAQKHR